MVAGGSLALGRLACKRVADGALARALAAAMPPGAGAEDGYLTMDASRSLVLMHALDSQVRRGPAGSCARRSQVRRTLMRLVGLAYSREPGASARQRLLSPPSALCPLLQQMPQTKPNPCAQVFSVPLVGVWLRGAPGPQHPLVLAACLRFACSATLPDRAFNEAGAFLLLMYPPGAPPLCSAPLPPWVGAKRGRGRHAPGALPLCSALPRALPSVASTPSSFRGIVPRSTCPSTSGGGAAAAQHRHYCYAARRTRRWLRCARVLRSLPARPAHAHRPPPLLRLRLRRLLQGSPGPAAAPLHLPGRAAAASRRRQRRRGLRRRRWAL